MPGADLVPNFLRRDLISMSDAIAPGRPANAIYPWIGAGLTILACLPALFARGLIGDDGTVYYAYYTEGAGAVAQMMRDAAHTGYSVPMLLFLWLSESKPNFAARFVIVAIHLLLAAFLQTPPIGWLRSAAAVAFLLAGTLSMARDGRLLPYDGYIAGDILRQTRSALHADATPKVFIARAIV